MSLLEKNTVSAENQVKKNVLVSDDGNGSLKIMFVGNSITLHGENAELGWFRNCGMAASSPEKDYVHQVESKLKAKGLDVSYCICQVSGWEREYKNGEAYLNISDKAKDFGADVIVMRIIENCPGKDFDAEVFKVQYEKLIDYLNPDKKARVILTTGFWRHPGDDTIIAVGKERGYDCIALGDIGDRDEMRATGLFEHKGVAMHPGDKGMEEIAERIVKAINK